MKKRTPMIPDVTEAPLCPRCAGTGRSQFGQFNGVAGNPCNHCGGGGVAEQPTAKLLAQRCRELADRFGNATDRIAMLLEAADEIERLERELAKKISADYANGYADGRRAADETPAAVECKHTWCAGTYCLKCDAKC